MSENKIAPSIIDNSKGRELVNVIKDQLKRSKEAKFAIGYFFLSGFNLVKDDFPESIEKKPFLKIVMGNETTYPTKEELVAGYSLREILKQKMIEDLQSSELTKEQIRQLKQLRDFIASNIIDVKLFENSRLHAKLYLFITKPEEKYGSPGLAVVGSSNFTAEGLTKNKELNVLLSSREEVLYLNEWFDRLWEESIEFREDLLKVIDLSGVLPNSPYPKIGKLVDPQTLFKYLVYKWFEWRVLNLLKKDILMEFQLVGVLNAANIMNSYHGVILADSVGLGKSFMASAIVEEFLYKKHPGWVKEGKKPAVLLILPPSLISQWEELLISDYYFLRGCKKKLIKDAGNYRVYEVYSEHEDTLVGKIGFLSIGIFQTMKEDELRRLADEYDLYVIDEAHKYRNKNTNRWKNVRKLQKKTDDFPNKFLLLTATPLNNSVEDIFNLIRLFVDDTFAPFMIKNIPITELIKKYRDLKRELHKKGDDSLRRELKAVATEIKQKILDEVMILRTRKYIMQQFKDLKVSGKPLVFKDPKPYSLDYEPFYTERYRKLISKIGEALEKITFEHTKLYGTRYVVFEEDTTEGEDEKKAYIYVEVSDLFKLLLGKRLESSIYAFETTLRRIYEKEKIFYTLFKARINAILGHDGLLELIKEALERAKIDKELEEIQEEYNIEEEDRETWFDRVVKVLLEYAEEMKEEGKDYTEIELLKLGMKRVLDNLENDLKAMDNIFSELDRLKESKNGGYKVLGKIPKEQEDIVDLPIYSYSNDPKLEALKQILGNPLFKSEALKDIPSLNGKKVIIFTQYKDTAYYLYHNLLHWIENEADLHTWLKDPERNRVKIGLVTGDTDTSAKINYLKRFAPWANNGEEEIQKFGEIEILISTDALSEGVNLQDADAVINFDLPWNPMVIVQRVGRVNRIGNEKDVYVINYLPSKEVEIIVGILKKLQEKIKDITLIVGKDVRILTSEEEVNIETFGEKIKDISKLSVTDLEEYGISEDFKQFIPKGIPPEQMDEYKLLNIVQYELGYSPQDFEDVIKMDDGPYYSFIEGEDKLISIYEFYRGRHKIMKKIMSISKNGDIKYETPLVFLNLIKRREKNPWKIENAIENLKEMKDKTGEIVEDLKEKYQQEQKGFLYNLYNALLAEREKARTIEREFKVIMNTLQTISHYSYSREIKSLLLEEGIVEESNRKNVIIKDFQKTVETLYQFFKAKGLSDIESLKIRVKHLGWYYEI